MTAAASGVLQISPRVKLVDSAQSTPSDRMSGSSNEIILRQQRSNAFGDGTHPTTRLCAAALDTICLRDSPRSVLDVGTGTGVLARIARARGVPFVVGTDIDASALDAAETNANLDLPRGRQSSGAILFTNQAPDFWGLRFDVVIANILENTLVDLAPALLGALAAKGVLLISGFTPLQVPALEIAFGHHRAAFGAALETEARLDGWALLAFRKLVGSDRRTAANSHF